MRRFFMNLTAEEIIVAMAIKYHGEWNDIYAGLSDPQNRDLDEYIEVVKRMKCKYVTVLSEQYPDYLRNSFKPPFVLFYYGDISLISKIGKNVAVVGSRECSDYAIEATKDIVEVVAKEYNIVSGMAVGIDTVAHEAAIEAGGKTIAVLGSGIDYVFPSSNLDLYKRIKENHLVISEYPGRTSPRTDTFPMRNRIIAMLACSTIVTEAYERSGTLTTVMFTLDYGRLLMCIPYPRGSNSECNRLIGGGAYLVENGNDVLKILSTNNHF